MATPFHPCDMIEAQIASMHGLVGQFMPDDAHQRHRAKLATPRWSISESQLVQLNDIFKTVKTPTLTMRQALAEQLGVSPRQIQVWFRNRRQRVRLSKIHDDSDAEPPLGDDVSLDPLEAVAEGDYGEEDEEVSKATCNAANSLHKEVQAAIEQRKSERATSPTNSNSGSTISNHSVETSPFLETSTLESTLLSHLRHGEALPLPSSGGCTDPALSGLGFGASQLKFGDLASQPPTAAALAKPMPSTAARDRALSMGFTDPLPRLARSSFLGGQNLLLSGQAGMTERSVLDGQAAQRQVAPSSPLSTTSSPTNLSEDAEAMLKLAHMERVVAMQRQLLRMQNRLFESLVKSAVPAKPTPPPTPPPIPPALNPVASVQSAAPSGGGGEEAGEPFTLSLDDLCGFLGHELPANE